MTKFLATQTTKPKNVEICEIKEEIKSLKCGRDYSLKP
jgi:hypothetical protein